MGLFSGLVDVFTANSTSKQNKNIAIHQANVQKIQNFQAKRRFLQDFRNQQASAIVGGLSRGGGAESSLIQGQLGSQKSQATLIQFELDKIDESGASLQHSQEVLARNNKFKQIASGIEGVASSVGTLFPSTQPYTKYFA